MCKIPNKFKFKYSVTLDESSDITDTAQLAVCVPGFDDNFKVMEEAHNDSNVCPDHRSGDILPAVWCHCGCQFAMEGEGVEEVIALHCIIHQQALCSKCLNFDNVMSVVKCINHIRSWALKRWEFCTFFEEIESEYEDVLYFTRVRWLSRGNVLKRVFELKTEVKAFVEKDGMAVPVLSDQKWLMDLAFLVDITQELNVLNKRLQGAACHCCL